MGKTRISIVLVLLVGLLISCSPVKPGESAAAVATQTRVVATREQQNPAWQPTNVAVTPTATRVVNPYEGKIWNQYCELIRENGMIVDKKCFEDWAAESLPGGCETKALNFKGYAGCTAASLAYVINVMLTPEEIAGVLGSDTYGVTPKILIEEVYPKLGSGLNLTCNGTGVPAIRETLEYFGLATRTKGVDKLTLERSILPGEMAMVGVSMTFKGEYVEHWTVPVRFEGGEIFFADSFVGRGSVTAFNDSTGVSSWEIISILFVSRTPR